MILDVLIPSLKRHGKAAAAGLLVLTVFSLSSLEFARQRGMVTGPMIDIGIEHTLPIGVNIEIGAMQGAGIIDIELESEETVYLSVPSSWTLREVRNTSLDAVISQEPTFGFLRWAIPPYAGVSFYVPEAPGSVLFHNPSNTTAKVHIIRVDLDMDTVEEDVILIQGPSQLLF